jgi:CubicO group peptidase (beta-lactamase class C family)
MVARMRDHRVAAPLRKTFIYSNANYALAGEFVARLAGKSYQAFVHDELLSPLGMFYTQFGREAARITGQRVEGFLHYGRDSGICEEPSESGEWKAPGAGPAGQMTGRTEAGDMPYFAAAGGLLMTGSDAVSISVLD